MSSSQPHDLESERALIKCILNNYELFYTLKYPVTQDTFYGLENAVVFKAFSSLLVSGKTPDVVLIKEFLKSEKTFEVIGGEEYFSTLDSLQVNKGNLNEYAKILHDAFVLRSIIAAGESIYNAGYSQPVDKALLEMYSGYEKVLENATIGNDSNHIKSLLDEELSLLGKRILNPGCDGFLTMFEPLDLLLGGLKRSDQVVVAARPSVGKTSVMLRMMLNFAKQGHPIGMFSYEMSNNQISQRMLAMESGINLTYIRTGLVTPEQYEVIKKASLTIERLPIYIHYSTDSSVMDIVAETKKMIRKYGVKSIFVDYLQLMPYRSEYATQDLGSIARQLKTLALSSDLLVVYASQLSRGIESRDGHIPQLSDLRQSGNLEEHADIVMMLNRPALYDKTPELQNQLQVHIKKHRNGPIGEVELEFVSPTADVKDVDRSTF